MATNYIDDLALDIYRRSEGGGTPEPDEMVLYRMYGLLALSKGTATTMKDVHDAWSAWCAKDRPQHRSLIPFEELTPDVQAMDEPYVRAIHDAALARGVG